MNYRNDRQNASGDPADSYSRKDTGALLHDAAPLWHDAFSSSARLLWRAARGVARLVGYFVGLLPAVARCAATIIDGVVGVLVGAVQARNAYEELSLCGDEELVRLGLTREDIPRRIARIMTGAPVLAADLVAVGGGRSAPQAQTDSQGCRAA